MSVTLSLEERYLPGRSFLHRLDARAKIVATLGFVFAVMLTPNGQWLALAALALVLAAVAASGRLAPLLVLRRSALALPFLLVAVPLLFTREGDRLFAVPLLGWELEATDQGLAAFGSVLVKSWLSVSAAVVLTATTAPLDLLRALRGLGVPRVIVATVLFMYRYLYVIGEEAVRLLRARDSRSARGKRGGGGPLIWRTKVLGGMIGSLFIRSYERSERVFDAMTGRGFRGEVRSLATPALGVRDWLAVALLAVLLTSIQLYART